MFGDLTPGDAFVPETETGQLTEPGRPAGHRRSRGAGRTPGGLDGPGHADPRPDRLECRHRKRELVRRPGTGDTVVTETATGQLIDPAAPPVTDGLEGQAAPPAASMGPATPTPGLIDWNAGTGNEPLFGDLAPGDATGGQGLANPTDTDADTESLINVIQPTPLDVRVVDPATGQPVDLSDTTTAPTTGPWPDDPTNPGYTQGDAFAPPDTTTAPTTGPWPDDPTNPGYTQGDAFAPPDTTTPPTTGPWPDDSTDPDDTATTSAPRRCRPAAALRRRHHRLPAGC